MNLPPLYRVIETTAMGETWWNVVLNIVEDDSKIDEKYVYGSFSKSKEHAKLFCEVLNCLAPQISQ